MIPISQECNLPSPTIAIFRKHSLADGLGEAKVDTTKIRIRSWTERSKDMMQLMDASVGVIGLTVALFGTELANAVMTRMRAMYVSGFTKEQLVVFKKAVLASVSH